MFDDPHTVEVKSAAVTPGVSNMLDDRIICGYQGWFGYPRDGAPIKRWRHWFHGNSTSPPYEDVVVDMYPTIDEYDANDLMESGLEMPDATNAKFFSSARPNVVLIHFRRMETHGILGGGIPSSFHDRRRKYHRCET